MSADRHIIGIGGLAAARGPGEIVTHALGSCLGVTVHDPYSGVGAMVHVQLPLSTRSPDRAREKPALFVDLGIPLLFTEAAKLGLERRRSRVVVAGGANVTATANDIFNIAKQNLAALRKIFWQHGVLIGAEETGGCIPRTMHLDLATGQVTIESGGVRRQL